LLGSFAATNSQVQAFSFGNPNLGAEEGETLTLGFVFEPDFLPIGNFKMTADYFDITLSNRIGARGAQTVLDSCYGGLGANPQSAQDCQAIVRDPASGQVIGVDTSRINAAGETQVTGYDVQADYAFDLNEILKGLPGSFDVNVLLTVTDKFQDGEDRFEGASSAGVGGAIPDWRTTTTMNYRVSDWVVQVRHVYVPGLAQLFPSAAVLPDTPEFSNFDLGVSWDVTDRLRLVGNVSNVFDEFPPQTVTGFFDQANTDAALYAPWVVGRTFSVQARYKF
jgi:outer membrane receptor protein involved in Fe transport